MMKLLFIFFFTISPNAFILKSRIQVNHILKSNDCEFLKIDKDVMYCNCKDYYINILFDENGLCKEVIKNIK
jgi:hypothetical protein